MKILLLSRYSTQGASSRIRSFQYIPYLESMGCSVDVEPLFDNGYIESLYKLRQSEQAESSNEKKYHSQTDVPVSVLSKDKTVMLIAYAKRLHLVCNSGKYDLVWIEKELFPWLPPWVEAIISRFGIPYVVDYDDAVFHKYDLNKSGIVRLLLKNKIKTVMRGAQAVIVGNAYLAEYAHRAGASRVEIIPSVVDLSKYSPRVVRTYENNDSNFIIGWIGTPSTVWYLNAIEDALREVARKFPIELVIVGGGDFQIQGVNVRSIPWTESSEVQEIQKFDIGVMPLPQSPYEMGKCGYKLIQYMACGVPAVASPVGVNSEIISNGISGFLASSIKEWVDAIKLMLTNRELYSVMREEGIKKVKREYNLALCEKKLYSLLASLGGVK
jgi:glycosyltransferase involved in cell wall biosynthesis